jgi:hypothetical protein
VEQHFYLGHYWGQQHQQQQQTNNIMTSSNNNMNNNTLGIIFVLTHRQFLLFIHSYCHYFGGLFMAKLHFYSGHYWGKKSTP